MFAEWSQGIDRHNPLKNYFMLENYMVLKLKSVYDISTEYKLYAEFQSLYKFLKGRRRGQNPIKMERTWSLRLPFHRWNSVPWCNCLQWGTPVQAQYESRFILCSCYLDPSKKISSLPKFFYLQKNWTQGVMGGGGSAWKAEWFELFCSFTQVSTTSCDFVTLIPPA